MLKKFFKDSAKVLHDLVDLEDNCRNVVDEIKNTQRMGNTILVAGNGGSCTDGLHFVGELTCTYDKESREPYRAICLNSNQAALTAWSNDFNFDTYYKRQVEALGKKGDILIIFSTSGGCFETNKSINLVHAASYAKKAGLKVISFLGKDGGELSKISDLVLHVRCKSTAQVQQAHITLAHGICELLEH
jgi:D-sedoheptulose 7-phosphate isomerase